MSGAKSDAGRRAHAGRHGAHRLATSCARSPATAPQAEAVKVVARAHKTLIWERTRHVQRLRHALREYFPAALEAFDDLTAADTLELLAKAPDPASAARLTHQPDQRGAQAGPPAQHRGQQGRGDPGRAARRAPGPAARSWPPPTPPPSAPRSRS